MYEVRQRTESKGSFLPLLTVFFSFKTKWNGSIQRIKTLGANTTVLLIDIEHPLRYTLTFTHRRTEERWDIVNVTDVTILFVCLFPMFQVFLTVRPLPSTNHHRRTGPLKFTSDSIFFWNLVLLLSFTICT